MFNDVHNIRKAVHVLNYNYVSGHVHNVSLETAALSGMMYGSPWSSHLQPPPRERGSPDVEGRDACVGGGGLGK